jgi:predicted component of type VI protein secretion system
MHEGRPPERWCFILDIRSDGAVPPAVIARRLLKHLLRRWGIKCKGYSEDRRMFELMEDNKRLRKIIDQLTTQKQKGSQPC